MNGLRQLGENSYNSCSWYNNLVNLTRERGSVIPKEEMSARTKETHLKDKVEYVTLYISVVDFARRKELLADLDLADMDLACFRLIEEDLAIDEQG